jgi:hypothetical protein
MPFDSLPVPEHFKEYDEVGQILLEARSLIETRGWCQHIPSDIDHRVCAYGAIKFASERLVSPLDSTLKNQAVMRFANTLPARKKIRWCSSPGILLRIAKLRIIYWNDRKSRTKKQVMAKFDQALMDYEITHLARV